MQKTFLFTSESVGEGHPDKICDQISDAILDAHLTQDSTARVAVETVVTTNTVMICGEVTSKATVDYAGLVKEVIREIGYDGIDVLFDWRTVNVIVCLKEQSKDIANAVNGLQFKGNKDFFVGGLKIDFDGDENNLNGKEKVYDSTDCLLTTADGQKINFDGDENNLNGKEKAYDSTDCLSTTAGDQGIMFGYATDETEELMPISLMFAHALVRKLKEKREEVGWLLPDCKSQVTIEYKNENGALIPLRVHTVVISAQHREEISDEKIKLFLKGVVDEVIPAGLRQNTIYCLNPSGRFVTGGPAADAGLTGRKIIVDSYGGFGAHGGGCFSGKDWSKVDRSGAYMARLVAKSLVYSKICKRVLIQISYAIGVCKPLSIFVDTYGTASLEDSKIIEVINNNFDFRPGAIKTVLRLDLPVFRKTAVFGHFGRNEFVWEQPKKLSFSMD